MVYGISTTDVTTAQRTAFLANKHLFLARNALEYRAQDPQWRRSGSWLSGTNDTQAGFDATRAADNLADAPTKPQLFAVSDYYLIFALVPSVGGVINGIDSIAILGHNFKLLPGTITVRVQIADDSAFATNLLTIATFNNAQTDGIRLANWNLSTFTRYTNVTYVRLWISTSSVFGLVAPEVGELFMGMRLQLGRRPNKPWSIRRIRGDVAKARVKGGSTTHYERNVYGVQLTPTYDVHINGVDPFSGLDDETTLLTLFRQSAGGTRNFILVDSPSSSPRQFHFLDWSEPDFEIAVPEEFVDTGQFNTEWVEQAPFYEEEAAA